MTFLESLFIYPVRLELKARKVLVFSWFYQVNMKWKLLRHSITEWQFFIDKHARYAIEKINSMSFFTTGLGKFSELKRLQLYFKDDYFSSGIFFIESYDCNTENCQVSLFTKKTFGIKIHPTRHVTKTI